MDFNGARLNSEVEEETKPERSTAKQVIFSISTKLWIFIRLNVLFLLFSIPVVTAPAAFTGMTKVLMNLVRKDDCAVWGDFWNEFKDSFTKSLITGVIFGGLTTILFLTGRSVFSSLNDLWGTLGAAVVFVFTIVIYIMQCYVFTQITIVNISVRMCFKNALILFFIEPKKNIMLLIPLLLLLLSGIFFPLSLPILLLAGLAICQYIVCRVVNIVIQKRLIDPFVSER